MSYRFNQAAELELLESALYYASRQSGLGLEFLAEVNAGVATILEAPLRWAEVEAGVRRYRIARFPFGLFYRAVGAEIEIIAVADLRRQPGYWRDRVT